MVDKSYSYISDILNTNQEGKPYALYLLIAVSTINPDLFRENILKFLSDISNSEPPRKKREMTNEEENPADQQKGYDPVHAEISSSVARSSSR